MIDTDRLNDETIDCLRRQGIPVLVPIREEYIAKPPKPKRKRKPRVAGQPNKLEAAFLEHIKARGMDAHFEAVTFRLGSDCRYTPDVFVTNATPKMFCEVKGPYKREDAMVKLRVAAKQYPCFRWLLVERDKSGWRAYEIAGNSKTGVDVAWITGGTA